ncbi:T9SS type A sorting domain-containing protein [Terrimonas rubra]|uniref:T9SS type A sorting domain-containing protein n=1 Tax=Terrimonas rubra TaxID=1035890 RepID=A0ABW6A2N7_9BACT
MYKKIYSLLMLVFFVTGNVDAQTQFWSDNFEDAGSPSSGSRVTSIAEFISCTTPTLAYFKRTTGAEISPIVFSGFSGTKFWAAMDIDRGPGCGGNNTISAAQSITWSGINITGKTGMTFRGLFGANSTAIFQGLPFLPSADSMAVSYRIDGGAWIKIVGVHCNDNTANGGTVGFDLNGDRIGDGGANTLGNTLSEITANIPGTGNTLDLRFNIFLNNQQPGAMAFDNFRLFSSSSLPVTWASFTAGKQGDHIALDWSTATEQNTKEFVVQHKTGTGNWNNIAVISAAGNSNALRNYNYTHLYPVNGVNYYRIQQTDLDEKSSFTDIQLVKFTNSSPAFVIKENPVVNGIIKVQLHQPADLFLYDMQGRLIWQQQQASGLISIPVQRNPAGLYTLRTKDDSKKIVLQ